LIDLGSLDLLPPTLTAQYHFMPENTFRPYVGAGLSYVLIPNEDPGAATAVRYDDGVIGYALQAGFDYFLTNTGALILILKRYGWRLMWKWMHWARRLKQPSMSTRGCLA
jgi:outer membrane protein